MSDYCLQWRTAFHDVLRQPEHAQALQDALARNGLTEWTTALTTVVVETCHRLGWHAAAKGYRSTLLPIGKSEYLSLDVMAFPDQAQRWQFPAAVFELENQADDTYIAYDLWKVLCVRVDLRIVFCYRASASENPPLIRFLAQEIIRALPLTDIDTLKGDTLIVIGNKGEAATFPSSYFHWWRLECELLKFKKLA